MPAVLTILRSEEYLRTVGEPPFAIGFNLDNTGLCERLSIPNASNPWQTEWLALLLNLDTAT
jgi:hypothetical protein